MTRTGRVVGLIRTAALAACAALLAAAGSAQATVPAVNGKIAFSTDQSLASQIFTVNPNGSGETQITKPAGDIDALAAGPAAFGPNNVFFLPLHLIHLPFGINGRIQSQNQR